MGRERRWFLVPLYWLLAALPLGAAFWVFGRVPAVVDIAPGLALPSGRAGVFVLPIVNVACSVLIYVVTERMVKLSADRPIPEARPTDIAQVVPVIRVFLIAWLSAMVLVVVYGYFIMDTGRMTEALFGRVTAFAAGIGTALAALSLKDATKQSTIALRWKYTMRSAIVWRRIHALAARMLYVAGALMLGTAFLLAGVWAVLAAGVTLLLVMLGLYLYAGRLYEDAFRG